MPDIIPARLPPWFWRSPPRGVPSPPSGVIVRVPVPSPIREFTRGVFTGAPRRISLAPGGTGTTETIYVSTRIGMQTRTMAIEGAKFVTMKTPVAIYRGARYALRSTVRDLMSPYYTGIHSYQFVRSGRMIRGATSTVERGADAYVAVSGRFLNRFGLAPSLRGTVASYARLALIPVAIKGIDAARGRLQAVTAVVDDFAGQARRQLEGIPVPSFAVPPEPRPVEVTQPILPVPVQTRPTVKPIPSGPTYNPAKRAETGDIPIGPGRRR